MIPRMKENLELPTNIPEILKTIESVDEITNFNGKLGM